MGAQSVNAIGDQINGDSDFPSLSGDGQFIAFQTYADNLVPNDNNGLSDVFVRDTSTGTVERISIGIGNTEANGPSSRPDISADGRYVIFTSLASNLVADDTNGVADVFVRDRQAGVTRKVSRGMGGDEANGASFEGVISSDGGYAAFSSLATNLVPNDTNGLQDVFQLNLGTDFIVIASRSRTSSAESNGVSGQPDIALNGEGLVFVSEASNLVPGDTNGVADVFEYSITVDDLYRVSEGAGGLQANGASSAPSYDDYGSSFTFVSAASNLVAGDTNGSIDVFFATDWPRAISRVSLTSLGGQSNADSFAPAMSADARYIVFTSDASNLVQGDNNGVTDAFVHDRTTGETVLASTNSARSVVADGPSSFSTISLDGRYIAIASDATILLAGDNNGARDILLRAQPQISVSSASPGNLPIGGTTSVTVNGKNFHPGVIPVFPGATVFNLVVVDENTITADVAVHAGQASGGKTLTVFLPGTGAGIGTGSTAVCVNCLAYF